jgi:hypothetical protein
MNGNSFMSATNLKKYEPIISQGPTLSSKFNVADQGVTFDGTYVCFVHVSSATEEVVYAPPTLANQLKELLLNAYIASNSSDKLKKDYILTVNSQLSSLGSNTDPTKDGISTLEKQCIAIYRKKLEQKEAQKREMKEEDCDCCDNCLNSCFG